MEQRHFLKRLMHELRGLLVQILSKRKSIDPGLIMKKSFIAKNFDIEAVDLLLIITELYTSAVSCLEWNWSQKIWLCFSFVSVLGY